MDKNRFWKMIIIGAAVGLTPLLAPIHELGHMIFGEGVTLVSWSQTHHSNLTLTGVLGGYFFEAFLYPTLCGVFHIAYTKTRRIALSSISIFCWGYFNSRIVEACFSTDFNVAIKKVGYSPSYAIMPWLIITLLIAVTGWIQWRDLLDRH